MQSEFLNGRVVVSTGDVTRCSVDVIVNAANSSLAGGGGVDGAIHRRGGPAISAACKELRRTQYPNGLPAGEVVLTTAGKLPMKFVAHAVGPIWGHDEPADALLASCYRKAIALADAHGLRSIAFPAIATGIYGFPKDKAAVVVSRTVADTLAQTHVIQRVHLVFYADSDREIFLAHQRF